MTTPQPSPPRDGEMEYQEHSAGGELADGKENFLNENDHLDEKDERDENEEITADQPVVPPQNTELNLTRTISEMYSVFTTGQKRWIIYFPALSSLSQQLGVTTELINLTITSYMIFQALAPTFFGELADTLGRRPVYLILFTIYLCANIGLALQRSYAALLILRMLQSTGSSGVIALANGVVADISHAGERGVYMGAVQVGAMLGPAIGPVIGGVLDSELGWWWIFWLLAILAAVYIILMAIVFPETGRKVVGNGSIPPKGINASFLQLMRARNSPPDGPAPAKRPPFRFPNPLASVRLIFQKDMALVLFANSILYTAFYTVMASLPTLFEEIYGFDSLQVGLCYLPFGVGAALACVVAGKIVDRDYRITAAELGVVMDKKRGEDMKKFPIEKARLRSIFWILGLYVVTFIAYGWVLWKETNLAAPLVLQFILGIVGTGAFTILSTLVVDLYPAKPSSATACNNLVRCLMGAGGTAAIESMIKAMGRGWCFTFVGLVCAAMAPLLWLERSRGMEWRVARLDKEKAQADALKAAKNAA
ncbi:major facilitator superfamily domain-containing protein [Pyronema domesticum]|nr:major facilitator superfamily domain-containing protein [Pyronema domesticum]